MEVNAEIHSLAASLEAILFTHGEPISFAHLEKILKKGESSPKKTEIEKGLIALKERLEKSGSGLELITRGEEVQLVTRPDLGEIVQTVAKEEFTEELTPAALETLAIVIYSGETPRSSIDYIRGVNSSFIVRNLLVRGLLERVPDPKRSNTYRYKPSFALLRHLGIHSVETLPDYQKFKEILSKFKQEL